MLVLVLVLAEPVAAELLSRAAPARPPQVPVELPVSEAGYKPGAPVAADRALFHEHAADKNASDKPQTVPAEQCAAAIQDAADNT